MGETKVQRYNHESSSDEGGFNFRVICHLTPAANGEWVQYSDYEALAERVKGLEAQLEASEYNLRCCRKGSEIRTRMSLRLSLQFTNRAPALT
jgi:hypothetical protein